MDEDFGRDYLSKCKCGKICLTKKEAQTKANYITKIGKAKKGKLYAYQCKYSDAWHISHERKSSPKYKYKEVSKKLKWKL